MVSQRGSVLAGVLGLSVVLSMAAASMLLVAANSHNEEDMAFRRAECYLDAESGLMMGVGWLRAHDSLFISTSRNWLPNDTLKLNFPDPNLDLGNQSIVTVKIVDSVVFKTVVSRAVKGSDTVTFSWVIKAADNKTKDGNPDPTLTLTDWHLL